MTNGNTVNVGIRVQTSHRTYIGTTMPPSPELTSPHVQTLHTKRFLRPFTSEPLLFEWDFYINGLRLRGYNIKPDKHDMNWPIIDLSGFLEIIKLRKKKSIATSPSYCCGILLKRSFEVYLVDAVISWIELPWQRRPFQNATNAAPTSLPQTHASLLRRKALLR